MLVLHHYAVSIFCFSIGMVALTGPSNADPSYETFGVAGASVTYANSINSSGAIAGSYFIGKSRNPAGFVRGSDSTTVTFTVPNASYTQAIHINKSGDVVGDYGETSEKYTYSVAFLRHSDGTIETIKVPGNDSSFATSINDKGEIIGAYPASDGTTKGFLRKKDGKYVSFAPSEDAFSTDPSDINSKGQIVGDFYISSEIHGFLREADGTFRTIDVPDAKYTSLVAISPNMEIAGNYVDANEAEHGFVRAADGTITTFDVPEAVDTAALGMNAKGTVTGYFTDASGAYHGFIRDLDGTITSFDAPGNNSVNTMAVAINNAGEITGSYHSGRKRRSPILVFVRIP